MNNSLRVVNLLKHQNPVFILAEATQPVTPAAHRAHEVQPEAINVRLGLIGPELCSAADADPHNPSVLAYLNGGRDGY